MFRASLHHLAARFAEEIDYLLAADFDFGDEEFSESDPAAGEVDDMLRYHREHPHRAQLPRRRDRRPGGAPTTYAHCITPVRAFALPRRGSG